MVRTKSRLLHPVLAMVVVCASSPCVADQASSNGFEVRISTAGAPPPVTCAVGGASIQCGATSRPAPSTVTVPNLVTTSAQDGWVTWVTKYGSAGSSPWSGLYGELSTRTFTVMGIEFLETTLSW